MQKKKDTAGNAKLRHVLVAYFEILDVAEIMGISRDDCDEALRLFKRFADSSSNVRTKNVESLAVAALVLVLRQADRSRDLPEFSAASGLLQKDLIQVRAAGWRAPRSLLRCYRRVVLDALLCSQRKTVRYRAMLPAPGLVSLALDEIGGAH